MNRLNKLAEKYFPADADAVLITSEIGRKYLLDFQSSAGALLVMAGKAYFIIDFRYIETAKKSITGCEIILQESLLDQIAGLLERHGIRKLGLEESEVTLADYNDYREKLGGCEILPVSGLSKCLAEMRIVKTPDEHALLREAQRLTDLAFSEILNFIRPGVSERQVAAELEYNMRRNGADGISFDTIAVAGVNSSLPHGHPSDYILQPGDFLTMDFGALYGGYHADMTRTVAIGAVSEEQKIVYNTVLEAQLKALDVIRAGIPCNEVDAVARDYITQCGYKGCFGHGLGHGAGLEIHEAPYFSPKCSDMTQEGMVLSVEPGIYLEGRFGVRIEDLVIIGADGAENITKSPKDLVCL